MIESTSGARLVHDTLEQEGRDVEIADAQKVKGLAPLAGSRIDSQVLVVLSHPTWRQRLPPRRAGSGKRAGLPAFASS